jgi:hypothetical protein
MQNFTRETIIEAIARLEDKTHSKIDRFLLRYRLEDIMPENNLSKADKVNVLIKYLLKNPDKTGPNGSNLTYEIIEHIAESIPDPESNPLFDPDPLDDPNLKFKNSLNRDGFKIENGELVPIHPDTINLSEKENELDKLLGNYKFTTAKGHLEQAISAHTRGDWAASNAQLRSFIEGLFDSIAEELIGQASLPNTSHARREELARINPPFLSESLNEWDIGNNSGFVSGFWKRLHPQGSHPGLSDQEDNTFRLHLVFLVSHHFLLRFHDRVS